MKRWEAVNIAINATVLARQCAYRQNRPGPADVDPGTYRAGLEVLYGFAIDTQREVYQLLKKEFSNNEGSTI